MGYRYHVYKPDTSCACRPCPLEHTPKHRAHQHGVLAAILERPSLLVCLMDCTCYSNASAYLILMSLLQGDVLPDATDRTPLEPHQGALYCCTHHIFVVNPHLPGGCRRFLVSTRSRWPASFGFWCVLGSIEIDVYGRVEPFSSASGKLSECVQMLSRISHPSQLLDGSSFMLLLLRPVLSGYMMAQCVRAGCYEYGMGMAVSAGPAIRGFAALLKSRKYVMHPATTDRSCLEKKVGWRFGSSRRLLLNCYDRSSPEHSTY